MNNTQQQIPIHWVEVQFKVRHITHAGLKGSQPAPSSLDRGRRLPRPKSIDGADRGEIVSAIARFWLGMERWVQPHPHSLRGWNPRPCLHQSARGRVASAATGTPERS